ncbi:hypothetical protein QUH51_25705, partial [Citrobacter freundii]|uniref:hypothetical protein n=1 Tax=Citrobacter freundii TaxID=546 RepID=UPI0025A1EF23
NPRRHSLFIYTNANTSSMPVFEVSVLMVPRAAWQSNTIKFNWNPTIENYGYIPVTHISIF